MLVIAWVGCFGLLLLVLLWIGYFSCALRGLTGGCWASWFCWFRAQCYWLVFDLYSACLLDCLVWMIVVLAIGALSLRGWIAFRLRLLVD